VTKRKVILHYHIFKNAGTSVDRMLEEAYGERWLSFDKEDQKISPAEMEEFIFDNPHAVAFSSHQVVPPLPSKRLVVYPIVLIRHPIDRAYSAYLFEWKKQQGTEEPIGSFTDYIIEKFSNPRKNAIEDYQALHLANRGYQTRFFLSESDEEILRNTRKFIADVDCLGVVDRYSEALRRFKKILTPHFPELVIREYRENALQDEALSLSNKVSYIYDLLDKSIITELTMRNLLDLRLYEYVLGLLKN
jgi:hypothetical protein